LKYFRCAHLAAGGANLEHKLYGLFKITVLQQSAILFTHFHKLDETGERSHGVSGFNYIPGLVLNSLGLSVHAPKLPEGTKNCP